jgi:hypothetical protein
MDAAPVQLIALALIVGELTAFADLTAPPWAALLHGAAAALCVLAVMVRFKRGL